MYNDLPEWARRTDNPRLMQTIQRYLESLRRSIDGDELYGLVMRVLRRHSRQGPIDNTCFADLFHHLDTYAKDPVSLVSARIKARLLQQHIAPYLPNDGKTPTDSTAEPVAVTYETTFDGKPEPARQGTLHARLSAAQERRERYDALKRSEQDAWRAIYTVARDFDSLKQVWTQSYDELAADRQRLEQKLADTEQALLSVEASARQLRSDVDSVRQAPAVRKPTRRTPRLLRGGTPRLVSRDVFLQQLQAEVSRVKRNDGAVALAMLGVGPLAAINELYGDGAETAVLNSYARDILSGFRAYDLIARHDEEVFAVLLPDTGRDGAVRALEKAQKRAAGTYVTHGEQRFPLPVFHGALSVYLAGEEPALWLQRAEGAIEQARRQELGDLIVA